MEERACCENKKVSAIAESIQRVTESLRATYETLFRIEQMIRADNKANDPEQLQPSCMRESVGLNYELAKSIENKAHVIYNELFGG